MVNYMEYIVLAIPILLGVIISKRYNIIFGFIRLSHAERSVSRVRMPSRFSCGFQLWLWN